MNKEYSPDNYYYVAGSIKDGFKIQLVDLCFLYDDDPSYRYTKYRKAYVVLCDEKGFPINGDIEGVNSFKVDAYRLFTNIKAAERSIEGASNIKKGCENDRKQDKK